MWKHNNPSTRIIVIPIKAPIKMLAPAFSIIKLALFSAWYFWTALDKSIRQMIKSNSINDDIEKRKIIKRK